MVPDAGIICQVSVEKFFKHYPLTLQSCSTRSQASAVGKQNAVGWKDTVQNRRSVAYSLIAPNERSTNNAKPTRSKTNVNQSRFQQIEATRAPLSLKRLHVRNERQISTVPWGDRPSTDIAMCIGPCGAQPPMLRRPLSNPFELLGDLQVASHHC